jgi:pimeloyl-ACP methyl ester carboxylesterase
MAEARMVRASAQWGDDVRAFCDVLGIKSPIVLGASFGGMVALAYATRHPAHPSKLVLISTAAAGGTHRERRVELFERFGGPEVGALARRRFLEVQGHPDRASLDAWARLAIPLYTRIPRDPDLARRAVSRPDVLQWFTKPGGESHTFNMLADLARIQCPTLVLGGEDDPIHPIESQAEIAAALPAHLVRFERFENCRHAVVTDAPEAAIASIRDFVTYR